MLAHGKQLRKVEGAVCEREWCAKALWHLLQHLTRADTMRQRFCRQHPLFPTRLPRFAALPNTCISPLPHAYGTRVDLTVLKAKLTFACRTDYKLFESLKPNKAACKVYSVQNQPTWARSRAHARGAMFDEVGYEALEVFGATECPAEHWWWYPLEEHCWSTAPTTVKLMFNGSRHCTDKWLITASPCGTFLWHPSRNWPTA